MDKTPVAIISFFSSCEQGFSKKLITIAQRLPPSMRTGVFFTSKKMASLASKRQMKTYWLHNNRMRGIPQ